MTLLYSFLIATVLFTGTAYCDSGNLRKLIAKDGVLTEAGKEALLKAHNDQRSITARGMTGTQPMAKNMVKLTWDQKIADTAQVWANNCKFKHDSSSYGENLFVAFSSADNIDNIEKLVSGVNRWYMEHTDYVYDGNKCNKVCGHYTQNVWANTKTVGCAYASKCGIIPKYPYDVLLVCRYGPPGNYVGQLPYEKATSTSEIASNCPSGYVGDSASGLCIKSTGDKVTTPKAATVAPTPIAYYYDQCSVLTTPTRTASEAPTSPVLTALVLK